MIVDWTLAVCDAVVRNQIVVGDRQRPREVAVTSASQRDISAPHDAAVTTPMMSTLCLGTTHRWEMTSMIDEPMTWIFTITKYAILMYMYTHNIQGLYMHTLYPGMVMQKNVKYSQWLYSIS